MKLIAVTTCNLIRPLDLDSQYLVLSIAQTVLLHVVEVHGIILQTCMTSGKDVCPCWWQSHSTINTSSAILKPRKEVTWLEPSMPSSSCHAHHNPSLTPVPFTRMLVVIFTFVWPCIVTNFFIIKPTRCTSFTNLFWNETLHVSDSPSVHHQEFIHCTLSNGMSYRFVDSFRAGPGWTQFHSGPARKRSTNLYYIPLLSVECINSWWCTEGLSETCRVSCQNKFLKIVHLLGFIIKKLVVIIVW